MEAQKSRFLSLIVLLLVIFALASVAGATTSYYTLSGKILAATGSPLSQASVILKDSSGSFVKGTTSDGTGGYSFTDVAGGGRNYRIEVKRDGYAPKSQQVTVDDANKVQDVSLTFTGYEIFGMVQGAWSRTNANLISVRSGTAYLDEGSPAPIGSGASFKFTGVASGSHALKIVSPPYKTETWTIQIGDANYSNTFTLTFAEYFIRGKVKGSDATGIDNANVSIIKAGAHLATVRTGTDGSYTFSGIAPGTYAVQATYGNETKGGNQFAVADADVTVADISFTTAVAGYTVSGTVTDPKMSPPDDKLGGAKVAIGANGEKFAIVQNNGAYSVSGVPAGSNVKVEVTRDGYKKIVEYINVSGPLSKNFVMDGTATLSGTIRNQKGEVLTSGTVTISGTPAKLGAGGNYTAVLPPRNYVVTASAPGYQQTTETVVARGGATTKDFVLKLTGPATYSVSGIITRSGQVVPGASVEIRSGTVTKTTTSDSGGNYTFTGVPEGNGLKVTATSGCTASSYPFSLNADISGVGVNIPATCSGSGGSYNGPGRIKAIRGH